LKQKKTRNRMGGDKGEKKKNGLKKKRIGTKRPMRVGGPCAETDPSRAGEKRTKATREIACTPHQEQEPVEKGGGKKLTLMAKKRKGKRKVLDTDAP